MNSRKLMGHPQVNKDRCSGCGRCVSACDQKLFTLEVSGYRKYAFLRMPARCNSCGKCLAACTIGALSDAGTKPSP